MIDFGWNSPPKDLALSNTEIHIWCASLEQSEKDFHNLEQVLSVDEYLRAQRFHFEKHQKQFILCRGILRTILGLYLDVPAREVQFCYGFSGKPALSDKFKRNALHFSLTYSSGIVLYAITKHRKIGIDVEKLRPIPEMDQIVKSYFDQKEYELIYSLPPIERVRGFFRYWTLKEAYLKANGWGLFRPLDSFTISWVPGVPPCLLVDEQFPEEVSRWSLYDFIPAAGYTTALAFEGKNVHLKNWQYA